MGLIFLWLGLSWVVGVNPDGAVAQSLLKMSFGGDYAWAWQDGGLITTRSIPSMSMAPALLPGDRVLCIKHGRAPQVGDIWIFNHPHSDRVMVKRIVAMAGDTVQVKRGLLIINGQEVGRTLVRSVTYFDEFRTEHAIEYAERLPGDARTHLIHEFSDADSLDETPVFKVPTGHVFMMGDNRDNSEDSRAPSGHRGLAAAHPEQWVYRSPFLSTDTRDDAIGFVPVDNLISRAMTVAYSMHDCPKQRGAGGAAECLQTKFNTRL